MVDDTAELAALKCDMRAEMDRFSGIDRVIGRAPIAEVHEVPCPGPCHGTGKAGTWRESLYVLTACPECGGKGRVGRHV